MQVTRETPHIIVAAKPATFSLNLIDNRPHLRCGSRLVGGGSQSVVVICRSTYERGGGEDDTCVVLLTKG